MSPPSNTLPPIRHDWQIAILETPIEVGYFKDNGYWFALARPFDLTGFGKKRNRAFADLQAHVSEYVEACITEGTAEFYSPSPEDEWARASQHRETYQVMMFFARKTQGQCSLAGRLSKGKLKSLTRYPRYRDRFVAASLQEAPCAV